MFNWFKNSNTSLQSTEQEVTNWEAGEHQSYVNAAETQASSVKKKPVHGEDGVCCGGCGGQG